MFQFALSRVPEVIREVLKEAEVPVEEIDAFILHQANSRIIDGVDVYKRQGQNFTENRKQEQGTGEKKIS